MSWHTAYATRGAAAVDAMPGGADWRRALEDLEPEGRRHLLCFEGHVTHLPERDVGLLDHIDVETMVGEAHEIRSELERLEAARFAEIMYTPTGPDVARELRTFAEAAKSLVMAE
jgi:5,10-methylenetetrahydromethanopterin reductase